VRIRYEPKASTLGPELVVSSPAAGATDVARGLAAAGDVGGDAAIAWVQGTGASTVIVAERLYQPPGAAAPPKSLAYSRTPQPVLGWGASSQRWGPITYTVTLDGVQVGQTGGTTIQVPTPLNDGPHSWRVTTSNPAGLTSTSSNARVFVDTVAPTVSVAVHGPRRTGVETVLRLTYRDAPPAGLPAGDASGVAGLTVRWGDGTVTRVKPGTHRLVHVYRRARRYSVTIVIVDKAGNARTLVHRVQIKKPPAKKPAHGKHR
jgi:hypothetical protein